MKKNFLPIICYLLFLLCNSPLFAKALPAPIFKNIGQGYFKADTTNAQVQTYFNQGMVLFYGFDFLEAIRSFEAAYKLDPSCQRCGFALSLSLGSITNAFIKGDEIQKAQKVLRKLNGRDPLTKDLIAALGVRYQGIKKEDVIQTSNHHCVQGQIELPAKNNLLFSDALYKLTKKYPNDQTVHTLYAFSIFTTDQWDFYDKLLQIRPYAKMMKDASQKALAINPDNVGAIHYLIHVTEWSADPGQSLPYARKLGQLAPLAEHLVHMPTHIYLRIGDYNLAVKQNIDSVKSYKEYEKICRSQGFQPVINFLNQHNQDFLFASALMAGRADIAWQTAIAIGEETPMSWIDKSTWIQRFYAHPYFAAARFGLWDKLKSLPKPDKKHSYIMASWAYANALSAINDHDEKSFQKYFKLFIDGTRDNNLYKPAKEAFGNNLDIAKSILLAKKALVKKQFQNAIFHWHQAVMKQQAGGDPPSWYVPATQGLAYAFLYAGDIGQAIETFKVDLLQHPNNGWALYGLSESYQALKDVKQANIYKKKYQKIWSQESVALPLKQGSDIFLRKHV